MMSQQTYVHVEKPLNGSAHSRSHPRVRVAQIVMDYLGRGWSAEEICRQHSYLCPAEVHAALAYYYDHTAEIDADMLADEEEYLRAKGRFDSQMRTPFSGGA